MQNNIVEKVVDILIDARNRNLTMGSILHSDCRYFASTLVKNDVVPVVRCKDCKYRQDRLYCRRVKGHPYIVTNTDFCSYGERKNDNGKL